MNLSKRVFLLPFLSAALAGSCYNPDQTNAKDPLPQHERDMRAALSALALGGITVIVFREFLENQ